MTTTDIILSIINLMTTGGGLAAILAIRQTLKKGNIEVKQADTQANTDLMKAFEDHILQPVLAECQELRKKNEELSRQLGLTNRKLDRLSRAVERIPECDYARQCPVSAELRRASGGNREHDSSH